MASKFKNFNYNARWKNLTSEPFKICNGIRQGSILSPYLFSTFIRELIGSIVNSKLGCTIHNQIMNILAYADDIVLLAPSWRCMQLLINILYQGATDIDMSCNIVKTVAMVFAPKNRHWSLNINFPEFNLNGESIHFVNSFKYLGHIIGNTQFDDDDINREIRNMFIRANILTRKFGKCTLSVKRYLFKTYCLCFYDIAL